MTRQFRMPNRLAAAGLVLAATAGSALAMPPGYCSNYAASAVREFHRAADNPNCASMIGGPRWHDDFSVHYNWCLRNTYDSTTFEWRARRETLHQCGY